MAYRAIPMMDFHRVNIYLLVCVTCVEYIVKDVASFQSLGQLMSIVHKRTALKLYRPAGRKLLVAYVETAVLAEIYYKSSTRTFE